MRASRALVGELALELKKTGEILGMRRGPYAKVAARNAALLERIRALKAEHPFWGYRRIWAYLRYVDGLVVNQKRIYGVMKAGGSLGEAEPQAPRQAQGRHQRSRGRPGRTSGGAST